MVVLDVIARFMPHHLLLSNPPNYMTIASRLDPEERRSEVDARFPRERASNPRPSSHLSGALRAQAQPRGQLEVRLSG